MKTMTTMKTNFVAVTLAALSSLTACVIGPDESTGAGANNADTPGGEAVGRTQQADTISSQDGFSVDWEMVGYPWAARKIAACGDGRLYALNDDKTLWFNKNGGADDGWSYETTPWAADSIACDGNDLSVLNDDKTLWHWSNAFTGLWSGWAYTRTLPQTDQLGSGVPGQLYALNFDKNIYTSASGDYWIDHSGESWTWRNYAWDAIRVTGASYSRYARSFALNQNGSLWYNDHLLSDSSPAFWHPFPQSTFNAVEIAADSTTVLYALDDTYHLWRGTVWETDCFDGIDNDNDGYVDSGDMACYQPLGEDICAIYADDGSYCFSRFFPNTWTMAICANRHLVRTATSFQCNVSSPGRDYLGSP